jgi:deoxyribodipyrimidine photolyase-related protein
MEKNAYNIFLLLHDQLNEALLPEHVRTQKSPLLFLESGAKGASLPYHKKKLVYVLSSQRHFAAEMETSGHPVKIWRGSGHYDALLTRFLEKHPDVMVTTFEAAEHDTRKRIALVAEQSPGRVKVLRNPFFLSDPEEWRARIQKGYRMELFYREMRRRTGLLMRQGEPVGGQWNYDAENRKALPKKVAIPPFPFFPADETTREVISLVEAQFPSHPGEAGDFSLAVTRSQALELLQHFVTHRLALFGPYEDAMKTDEALLFHSGISTYLNNGLLLPLEVCEMVEKAYLDSLVPLESAEGFIRQIIGWREYVRNYYEVMMPEVRSANALRLKCGLPEDFWTGKSELKCLDECAGQVQRFGYSHHITRLMVLSNFATLTDSDPAEVLRWFHAFYTDAYEWVVLPNVLGMSTYADGGVMASKPYVSSGNYINKMSDYCSGCRFDVKKRTGHDACPFNALYWRFVAKNRALFEQNGRVSFMTQQWDKMPASEKLKVLEQAESFIENLPRYPKQRID